MDNIENTPGISLEILEPILLNDYKEIEINIIPKQEIKEEEFDEHVLCLSKVNEENIPNYVFSNEKQAIPKSEKEMKTNFISCGLTNAKFNNYDFSNKLNVDPITYDSVKKEIKVENITNDCDFLTSLQENEINSGQPPTTSDNLNTIKNRQNMEEDSKFLDHFYKTSSNTVLYNCRPKEKRIKNSKCNDTKIKLKFDRKFKKCNFSSDSKKLEIVHGSFTKLFKCRMCPFKTLTKSEFPNHFYNPFEVNGETFFCQGKRVTVTGRPKKREPAPVKHKICQMEKVAVTDNHKYVVPAPVDYKICQMEKVVVTPRPKNVVPAPVDRMKIALVPPSPKYVVPAPVDQMKKVLVTPSRKYIDSAPVIHKIWQTKEIVVTRSPNYLASVDRRYARPIVMPFQVQRTLVKTGNHLCLKVTENNELTCKFCNFVTGDISMIGHYTECHSDFFHAVAYKCKNCIFKSAEVSEAEKHAKEWHPFAPPGYKCHVCSNQFKTIDAFKCHYLWEHFELNNN